MPPEDLREKTISSTPVFRGKLLDVYQDEVCLPDGRTSIREYIRHPGAAVIVPFLEQDRIILLRQFRYALDQVLVELPAGKLDPGEIPETNAKRELAEETGYTSSNLTRLGIIHPCIGYSDEQIVVFIAEDLTRLNVEGESDEFVEPFELTLPEALVWIENGKITDVKTIIALYWAERYFVGKRRT
ncbi:NUDIX domain-containing protein [Candidatus Neomarinimicrobiota bacterium]